MADHNIALARGEGEEAKARLLTETTQLVESAEKLERASRLLPTDEDFHFYSSFKEFREPVREIEARVNELLSQFCSFDGLPRAPSLPSDPDDLSDWLVSMQDELLEQVDSSFDFFRKERAQLGLPPPENDAFLYQDSRKKRRRDAPMKKTKPLAEAEGTASMQAEKCPVPFHVWSIPRPQLKFDTPVDNSNTPFQHRKSLSSSVLYSQPDIAIHPLQVICCFGYELLFLALSNTNKYRGREFPLQ
ncbi:hypothetical protein L7F22_031421 [Adiantum nelumboides]|nr:hypothetical protein [Adiantum nelumboides]